MKDIRKAYAKWLWEAKNNENLCQLATNEKQIKNLCQVAINEKNEKKIRGKRNWALFGSPEVVFVDHPPFNWDCGPQFCLDSSLLA